MNRPVKLVLGIVSCWPIVYIAIFFILLFLSILGFTSNSTPIPGLSSELFANTGPGIPPGIIIIFGLHLFTILLNLALLIFYIVNVFRSDRVSQDKKVLWAVILFFGGMIAMPVYWYLYIWKDYTEVNTGNQS